MKKVITLALVLLTLSACKKPTASAPEVPAAAPAANTATAADHSAVIARFNGEPITDEDIKKVAGSKLAQAQMELFDVRKAAVDQIIEDRILEAEAKKKGITKDQLLKNTVYDKIKIEDKDIEKFYNEKKTTMQGKKLDDVKSNIRGFIFRDRYGKLYGDYMKDLKKDHKAELLIKAPKVEIEEGDSPAIGPKDAPIKIVEFTDFQCPFCGRARPTINQVLDTYKGKVRYVLRDFPLSFHKDAQKAHEAAHCANDQGKYWDYNKKLFANQTALKPDDLKKYAGEVKLNMDKFNECLESGKHADLIKKNQEDASKVGVSGTPAFFINGRMLSGARPFEAFKEIIDNELENLN